MATTDDTPRTEPARGQTGTTARPSPPDRKILREEVLIVLALTFASSAVFALIDLLSAPIKGVSVAVFPSYELAKQLASIAFSVAPVWLVVYLVRRSGEGIGAMGLSWDQPGRDVALGVGLTLIVAAVGLGIYEAAVNFGINRFVIPVPPTGHWWTVPVLFLGSIQNGLLEEVIVVGYLLHRFSQMGWSEPKALWASALLRGSYHLYQGFGGFAGNLALGFFFGFLFQRWRRTWPLVIAHSLVDILAGIGYLVFRGKIAGL